MSVPLRVLLVEDSKHDVMLVLEALRWDDFEPHYAHVQTEQEMVAALADNEWDIILCDYSLPRFDALGALRLLKESKSELPLIIVSGTVGEETAVTAIKQGAADYVMKDRLTRLGTAVNQTLLQSRTRGEQKRLAEAFTKEHALFNSLVDTIPDHIYFKDKKCRFIRINTMMARHFGLRTPDDARGKQTTISLPRSTLIKRARMSNGSCAPANQLSTLKKRKHGRTEKLRGSQQPRYHCAMSTEKSRGLSAFPATLLTAGN